MDGAVVVVRPFGRHKVGELIAGAGAIREALSGEYASHVVVTQTAAAPGTTQQEG